MTLSISSNLRESFDFAKDGLVGYWVRWLALIIISAIPIVNFIAYGYSVKIYRGVSHAPELDLDLDSLVAMFIDGLKIFIISLAYMIIPVILMVTPPFFMDSFGVVGVLVMFIGFILAIALCFLSVMGCIRFAKTNSLGEAFNFGALIEKIGEIGWGNYILAFLVFFILICLIAGILSFIPVIGWILIFIIVPLLVIWQAKYFENIYSLA